MPGRSPSRDGFTLLELLAVLLVMSLAAAFTVKHYFAQTDVTLENAAILLARDLRAAQHRSLLLNEPSLVLFLPDGAGYVVTDKQGNVALNPMTDEPFVRSYPDDGVFDGVKVLAAASGDDRTLEIDKRGMPSEGLEVTLGFEGDERVLILEGKSGAITLVGSSSGWVDLDS
ncbi:MAG: prepilin-type N-terminal cleavage/methylation domain-containing protein [Planctomycetota bacterium]